jgi:outer membrane protein assembly factor BamD
MDHGKSVEMRKTARMALVSLVLVGAGLGVTACQSDKDIDITKLGMDTENPQTLYDQGLANMKAGNFNEATRKFDAVDKQNPFTEWGRKALVMATYVRYRQNKGEEAIATGNRYLKQYPNSDDSAYVQYLVGMSYSKQIADVTQDQKAAGQTIAAMTNLVKTYPNSPYVDEAQAKIRKEYLAAIQRFRNVVETYPNTNQIEEALARLTEAYYAMGIVEEAQTAAAILGRNYPDSQWYADSYKLLHAGGVEPRENKSSWISKTAGRLLGTSSATQ